MSFIWFYIIIYDLFMMLYDCHLILYDFTWFYIAFIWFYIIFIWFWGGVAEGLTQTQFETVLKRNGWLTRKRSLKILKRRFARVLIWDMYDVWDTCCLLLLVANLLFPIWYFLFAIEGLQCTIWCYLFAICCLLCAVWYLHARYAGYFDGGKGRCRR